MDFVTNVGASIVGAVLFWLVTKYLQPGLHQLLWRGAQVAGSWDFFDADPVGRAKPVGKLQLRQRAGIVWGTAVRHTSRDGEATHREFKYVGEFGGREMVLTFHAPDRPDYIRGALVLHLNNAGSVFSGSTTYYNDQEHTVVTYPIWYSRTGL
jgi:hypothetical protein